jgi:predicted metal-dependent TIM-barrel fold hydrolase
MTSDSIKFQPLTKGLRAQLESTIKTARVVAENGAMAALSQLGVAQAKAPDNLTEQLKRLRQRLRAHGHVLGDVQLSDNTQDLQHLV